MQVRYVSNKRRPNRFFLSILSIILLGVCLNTPAPLQARDMFQWKWSNAPLFDHRQPMATQFHIMGSAYMSSLFDNHMEWWKADLLSLGVGVAWEVKDGFIPDSQLKTYKVIHNLGGEGFSYTDIIADAMGIAVNRLVIFGWNGLRYGHWTFKSQ